MSHVLNRTVSQRFVAGVVGLAGGAGSGRSGLRTHIENLDREAQCILLAMAWFGREEAAATEWEDFVLDAERSWTSATAAYLAAMPDLAEHLRTALAVLRATGRAHREH